VRERYLDGVIRHTWLDPGTTYYFWVEVVDARGDTGGGPQSIGRVRTRPTVDMQIVEHGPDIAREGDVLRFNGSSSYVHFADMAFAGGAVDYGDCTRSGNWSMTFWIKPLVDPSQNIRFLVIKNRDPLQFINITNNGLQSDRLTNTETDLTYNTWYFFAVSVEDHKWTLHANADSPMSLTLTTRDLGTWDTSGMPSNRMFIGVNNNGTAGPSSWRPSWWDGYATRVHIYDLPMTAAVATATYNSSRPQED
jgi:hypothetical protein